MSGKAGLIIIVILGLILLVGSSMFYTVNQSEHAILLEFEKPVRWDLEPGLHFKWPIVNRVHKYDNRLRVFHTTAIEQTLGDQKTIVLQAFLCWRITDPLKFYESVKYEAEAEQKLNDIASSALGSSVGTFPIGALISVVEGKVKLPEIEQKMKVHMADRFKDDYGVTVERFGINRLALPPKNEAAVYRRMETERKVAAKEYESQGRKEADEIRAKAKRIAEDTITVAMSDATRTRGLGEAKAAKTYADAYSKDAAFYKFWRTLETYKKVFASKATLVIPSDIELMRYFRTPEVEKVVETMEGKMRSEKKKE